MPKKKTIEEVRETYTSNNCILITTEYDGQYTKMTFRCTCDQIDTKTYKDYRNTPWCNFSNHNERLNSKKEKGPLRLKIISSLEEIEKKTTNSSENLSNDKQLIMSSDFYEKINSRRWNKTKLIYKGDEIHGKGSINYNRIIGEPKTGVPFELECNNCDYIWSTNVNEFINAAKPRGCGWCKDELANIKNFNLYIVSFIGTRIHKNKYSYELIGGEEIKSADDFVRIWCKVLGHERVNERIIHHLNRRAVKVNPCTICEAERLIKKKEKGNISWNDNLEEVIRKGEKKHGKGTYDYSLTQSSDIINSNSILTIRCNRTKTNGSVCEHIFKMKLHSHINGGNGCPDCFLKVKYNLQLFLKRANEVYTNNEFSYELIREEDIIDSSSKPRILCTVCRKELTSRSINHFINIGGKQCGYCYGLRKWDPKRLREECSLKETEGLYDYSLVEFDKVINNETQIKILCKICVGKGFGKCDFFPSINNHFNNESGCPRCSGTMPWNYERAIGDIPALFQNEYDYSFMTPEMINSSNSQILVGHRRCGNIFKRGVADHLFNMKGCTFCSLSSGSQIIFLYLRSIGIDFECEVQCPGLGSKPYRYDYEIYYNENTIILEYDGIFHFKVQEHCSLTEQDLEKSKIRDIYKHHLALKEGKKIIRIDHTIHPSEISKHIDLALKCLDKEYFSTPSLYEWLIEGVKNYST
jgi:hypothetical protein